MGTKNLSDILAELFFRTGTSLILDEIAEKEIKEYYGEKGLRKLKNAFAKQEKAEVKE